MGSKNFRKSVCLLVSLITLLESCMPYTSSASSGLNPGARLSAENRSGLEPDQARMILHTTVQVYMRSRVEGQGLEKDGVKVLYGLGTLVSCGAGTLLVTHDHWEYIDQAEIVQFYNAEGLLLLEMNKDEFTRSILYRDTGTLALKVPARLATSEFPRAHQTVPKSGAVPPLRANVGDAEVVPRGSIVFIARHQPNRSKRVGLLAAEVKMVKTIRGVRVFNLQSLNGEAIVRGDSGGGVWYNGQLVGNTWMTYAIVQRSIKPGQSPQPKEIYVDKSTSALLPDNLLCKVDSQSPRSWSAEGGGAPAWPPLCSWPGPG